MRSVLDEGEAAIFVLVRSWGVNDHILHVFRHFCELKFHLFRHKLKILEKKNFKPTQNRS